jgi:capsid portal protein
VFHLLEPDINQELYGMPEYLSALNSAWLNESATLFRRKLPERRACGLHHVRDGRGAKQHRC